jgi:hypothetical protein
MHPLNLRIDAADDAVLHLPDQVRIRDRVILAPLVVRVVGGDGLAVDLAHEARFLAAMLFIETDQVAAEFRLEHVRDDQHGGGYLETGELAHLWQGAQVSDHLPTIAAILFEREDGARAGWG